jgi:hypothetical protein
LITNNELKNLQVKAYNSQGKLVAQSRTRDLTLPEEKGIYLIVVETKKGKTVKKVIRE